MMIEKLRSQYAGIEKMEAELRKQKQDILDQVKALAKYKPGDTVVFRETPGIVRVVVAIKPSWNNEELSVGYRVGKVTKSGKIHQTQDVYYCDIREEELSDGK